MSNHSERIGYLNTPETPSFHKSPKQARGNLRSRVESTKTENFITESIDKATEFLGKETVVEILHFLSNMKLIGAFFRPYHRKMMVEQAPDDIKSVFRNNFEITSEDDIPRLISAWESWGKESENSDKSFQDFLRQRKAEHKEHTGKYTTEILLTEKTASEEKQQIEKPTANSEAEKESRDFINTILEGKEIKLLISLARNGELPSIELAKLDTFSITYSKNFTAQKKQEFSKLWETLTNKTKLRTLSKQQLAKTLSVNIQDIIILEENRIRIENRGEKGDVNIAVTDKGDYKIEIAGETKAFLSNQTKELIHFLKKE